MIYSRHLRRAMSGGFMGLCMTAAALYGGYHAYSDWTTPYKVTVQEGSYRLVDKSNDRSKIITSGFELGTLEERLKGIAKEPKDDVIRLLERMEKR
jgi:hypothetical protein